MRFGFLEHQRLEKDILDDVFINGHEGSLFKTVARTNATLPVIDGVNTEKFDKIVNEVDVNDNGGNFQRQHRCHINKDGYVDLSDVMSPKRDTNSVSYHTDINGDGKTDFL